MERLDTRDASTLVDRRLGEFVVRELLSSGGFGSVYRAEQPALAREAVIKVMHMRLRASETLIQRFLREARLASRLDHPYAAHIYAFGAEPDGVLWIAMELVRGTPLDKLLELKGAIPLERFVPLLERICQVVQTAHDQGIVHRDIKPANVMVLSRAGQLLPKLLDLGIAKLAVDEPIEPTMRVRRMSLPPGETSASFADTVGSSMDTGEGGDVGRLTEEGAVIGSPFYMAPEQWTDAGTADARTDIYALGVLSYEALTGKPPFEGNSQLAIAYAHAQQRPPRLGGDLPPSLDVVIARALAKRPEDRYASALALATAFRIGSGIAEKATNLPRLPDALRLAVLSRAPYPLARAAGAFDAARNAHQARDAVWQLLRVVVRLIGTIALAAHSHVGNAGRTEVGLNEALRRLRKPSLSNGEWMILARELTAPFEALRDAYPIPELIDFLAAPATLPELLALHDRANAGASDEQVRELLASAIPMVEQLLEALAFLELYPIVVPTEAGGEVWMGVRRYEEWPMRLRGERLPLGQPVLASSDGTPMISLWPFVQLHEPAPGVDATLFLFEGSGRLGARLVALPDAFDREDDALRDAIGAMVREPVELDGRTSIEEVCPYPGLASFTASDAKRFFGRERETEAFANRLRAHPMLVVVGPSGAGKSSFVQAGVVARFPADWQVVTLRPGPAPMASLAARLERFGLDPAVLRDPDGLGAVLRARADSGTVVIVVDQLEELFTLCEDADERQRFAEILVRAARTADDPVRVIFTLRDDFLLHAEAVPALRTRLAPALHLLTTPGRDELLRILTEPLKQAGYELDDPTLAKDMVDALASTRSALALLSFTCSKLWELRDRRFRQIARKAYVSLGGVGGALAQHAEATLDAMVPDQQRLVRETFRHLVTAEGTRAVLGRDELHQILGNNAHATAAVEQLIAARLLVSSDAAGGEQIEVTHEALLDAWPRLVTWRREDSEGARLRDQLRAAARQWSERGRANGLLWRGDALAEYRLWRARYLGSLTELEDAFAKASLDDAIRGKRLRTRTLALVIVLLAVGVITLLLQNANVASQRTRAEDSQRLAEVSGRKLSEHVFELYEDQGRQFILNGDPDKGLGYLALATQEAKQLGVIPGPGHDFLVGSALRIVGSRLGRLSHDDQVYCARFSPDDRWIVTCGDDRRARIWDATTGKLVSELVHAGPVYYAEFATDGTVVTASGDGTAATWDAATGSRRHVFDHGSSLQVAVVAPDGRVLVTVSQDDVVKIWDLTTGRLRAILQPERHPGVLNQATPVAFSPDSVYVAVGDSLGTWRMWDAHDQQIIHRVLGHRDRINTLRFAPDGQSLVTASNDSTAMVWDVVRGTRRATLSHTKRVNAAVFNHDGTRIATASNDWTAAIWSAVTGERELVLKGHVGGVNVVAFRSDDRQIATGADDMTAMLWDTVSGRQEAYLTGHEGIVLDVHYDLRGQRLVTANDDHTSMIWRTESQQPMTRLIGHDSTVYRAEFSPDDRRVVTAGGRDGTSRVWDRTTGRELLVLRQSGDVVVATFDPMGERVATGGVDRRIHVWDAHTGLELRTFAGHTETIVDLMWDRDGSHVVSASKDGTARIWSLMGGAPMILRGHDAALETARFDPSGRLVVTTGHDNVVRLWDARTTQQLNHWPFSGRSAWFDPTGTLVFGISGSAARIWRVDTDSQSHEFRLPGDLMSVERNPDGRFMVTSRLNGMAQISDVQHGETVALFADREPAALFFAGYSHDGQFIVTSGHEGRVAIWKLPNQPPSAVDLDEIMRCQVLPYVRSDRRVSRTVSTTCAAVR